MRSDMAKVIVERPRTGGGTPYPRHTLGDGRRVSIEECRKRESIRRAGRKDRKYLNENLAPLRRFLRANVGRPWNKVYSEVCESINRDSAVQLHVWQHLTWEVCTNPYVIDDTVRPYAWTGYRFYVEPKTGLLRENKRWRHRWVRAKKAEQAPPVVKIDETREYRLVEGLWYEIEFATLPEGQSVFDIVLKQHWPQLPRAEFRRLYGRDVYAVRKRQLNKKEIRRLPDFATDGHR